MQDRSMEPGAWREWTNDERNAMIAAVATT
jgi:hypothetical protein